MLNKNYFGITDENKRPITVHATPIYQADG